MVVCDIYYLCLLKTTLNFYFMICWMGRLVSIQICHGSVGILMECLSEGGWFCKGGARGKTIFPEGRHSVRIPTLAWHICFIIPNKPQFGKISMKTTMTAGRSSENGGRFAGGHFAGGHDGMANLCKPITAFDFHVRYNNIK